MWTHLGITRVQIYTVTEDPVSDSGMEKEVQLVVGLERMMIILV